MEYDFEFFVKKVSETFFFNVLQSKCKVILWLAPDLKSQVKKRI